MSLTLLFLFSFAVGFGAVVTPGPVSTAIVTESARRGFVVGPLICTGHCALEFVMVALLALGLSAGLNTPAITNTISVLGGVLLVWMGGMMMVSAFKGAMRLPRPGTEVKSLNNWQLLGLGVGATLVNPFWYAWWVTVGATYIVLAQLAGWVGVVVCFLGHIAGDYLWDCILSGVVGSGRKWLTDSVYKWAIIACGAYLSYLGIVFVAQPFWSR